MNLQSTPKVIILLLFALSFSSPVLAQTELQPPRFDGFKPGNFGEELPPGLLVRAQGAHFARRHDALTNTNQPYEAQVYLLVNDKNVPLQTFVESDSRLYFLIPYGVPCGWQSIVIANINLIRPAESALSSAVGRINLKCISSPGEILRPQIGSLAPQNADPGDEIAIQGRFYFWSPEDELAMKLLIGSRETDYHWLSPDEIRFEIPANTGCNQTLDVQLVQPLFDYSSVKFSADLPVQEPRLLDVSGETRPIKIVCSGVLPPPGEGSPVTPDALLDFLLEMDADHDCYLNDAELFAAIDRWVAGLVDEPLFIAAVDIWIDQTKFCNVRAAAARQAVRITLVLGSHQLLITAGSAISRIETALFDASGRQVAQQRSEGRSMGLDLRDGAGRPLANGVYFAQITLTGPGGKVSGQLRPVFILR